MHNTLHLLLKTKSVGYLGGFSILFNQMAGPGVPYLAAAFQIGWALNLAMYIVFTVIAGFSMLFLIQAIQSIPGNSHFQGNVEYSTLIHFYFGPKAHIAGQAILFCALQSYAIQCIVLIAQNIDLVLVEAIGHSCGLTYRFEWTCADATTESQQLFGHTFTLFTIGLLVSIAICVSLSFSKLKHNVLLAVVACLLSIAIGIQWIASACLNGLDPSKLPAASPFSMVYGQMMGTAMLNLASGLVVPSWINIKSKDVDVQKAIWSTMTFTSAYYVVLGSFTALSFPVDSTGNVLQTIFLSGPPSLLSKITVGLFAFAMLLPGVPVCLIVSKSNLVQNKLAGKPLANVLCLFLPCLFCIPLMNGASLAAFQTWTSTTFVAICNFVLPYLLYFQCRSFRQAYNKHRVLTKLQLEILAEVHSNSKEIKAFVEKNIARVSSVESGIRIVSVPSPGKQVDDAALLAFKLPNREALADDGLEIVHFVDGLPEELMHDIPDADTVYNLDRIHPIGPIEQIEQLEQMEMEISERNQSNGVPGIPQNRESIESTGSLPKHPHFTSRPFKAVPNWMKIKESTVAKAVMVVTIGLTVLNIVIGIAFAVKQ